MQPTLQTNKAFTEAFYNISFDIICHDKLFVTS